LRAYHIRSRRNVATGLCQPEMRNRDYYRFRMIFE
jgi:hypothetical protein